VQTCRTSCPICFVCIFLLRDCVVLYSLCFIITLLCLLYIDQSVFIKGYLMVGLYFLSFICVLINTFWKRFEVSQQWKFALWSSVLWLRLHVVLYKPTWCHNPECHSPYFGGISTWIQKYITFHSAVTYILASSQIIITFSFYRALNLYSSCLWVRNNVWNHILSWQSYILKGKKVTVCPEAL
jgi:hypothetical protein